MTINSEGKILITKRHPSKPYGDMWEITGGAVVCNENSIVGACRELREETGIIANADEFKLINSIRLTTCFVDTYVIQKNVTENDLSLQMEEVTDAKFVSVSEFKMMCEQGLVADPIAQRFDVYYKNACEIINF